MRKQSKQEIINELSTDTGYSSGFKQRVFEMLPQLHYDYDLGKIFCNSTLIPVVDRIRWQYKHVTSVVCDWHDTGPEPFGGDYMTACLDDYNDLFIVFLHPTDELQSVGVHVSKGRLNDGVSFGFNTISFDEDDFISEEEVIIKLNEAINNWG